MTARRGCLVAPCEEDEVNLVARKRDEAIVDLERLQMHREID